MSRAIDAIVAERGADAIFGVVAEVIGERSGLVLDGEGARALAAACQRHDLPLILVETASGCYRGGHGPWGVDALPAELIPDLVLWYPGGQIGHVFVGDRYYISAPLALISTWDGDELSAIRAHEHLRAARRLDLAPAIAALDRLLHDQLAPRLGGVTIGGRGLYRTITFDDPRAALSLHQVCERRGLLLGRGLPGVVIFAPPLTITPEALDAAGVTLSGLCESIGGELR